MIASWLLVRRSRRAARKGEAYIAAYRFPNQIEKRVRRRFPELDVAAWGLVEQGLREWLVCCAWRGRTVLGMPSQLVDEAWHEFILDSVAYIGFCEAAFGEYLHHTPDEAMTTPMGDALADTVRAWDRSEMGAEAESVLWDLDQQLGAKQPLGLDELAIVAARTRSPYPLTNGWVSSGLAGGYVGASGSEGGVSAGCGAGGSGEGGGCGGGGCGGGGCGGGGS